MAGVPDQPIAAEVERGVQRQAQLDDAEVRRKVGRAAGNQVAQRLAHFSGELFELGRREALQIARRLDFRQQVVHQWFLSTM